jgi:hypothetical protein
MKTKKQMSGFLSQSYYEDFAKLDISVGEFLEANDDSDRMALLQLRKYNPIIPEIKKFC